jgi:hypothetical protein
MLRGQLKLTKLRSSLEGFSHVAVVSVEGDTVALFVSCSPFPRAELLASGSEIELMNLGVSVQPREHVSLLL